MSGLRILRACLVGAIVFTPRLATANGDPPPPNGDPPPPLSLSVPENSGAGAVVGDLATDSAASPGRYSIVAGNQDGAFSIDPRSGRLTVKNPAVLNHEVRQRYELVLRVTRAAADDPARRAFVGDVLESGAPFNAVEELLSAVEDRHVTVLVLDRPEPPVLPAQSATLMLFGSDRVEESRIDAHDEDDDDPLHFEVLAGAPAGLVGIDRETGRIWIDRPGDLAPGDHEFPLTVRVTDSTGQSDATTIALRVVALAGEPSSLVVAAQVPVPTEPSDPAETDSAIDLVEVPAGAAADSARHAGTAIETPIAVITPTVRPADDAANAPPLAPGNLPASGSLPLPEPATPSLGGRILKVAGIFLLLGVVVAVVMGWLWWRTQDDAEDLAVDNERLLRLQSISEEAESRSAPPLAPPTPTPPSPLEEIVLESLNDPPTDHNAHADADTLPPVACERVNDGLTRSVTGDTQFMDDSDLTGAPGEELDEPDATRPDLQFECSRDDAHKPAAEELPMERPVDVRLQVDDENLTDDYDWTASVDTTPLPSLVSQDTESLTRIPVPESPAPDQPAADDTADDADAQLPEPGSNDPGSDVVTIDPRLSQLRSELAEKFGIALPALGHEIDPVAAGWTSAPDPADSEPDAGADAEGDNATVTATAGGTAGEPPEVDSNPTEEPAGAFGGSTLTSARFMTKQNAERPTVSEPVSPQSPETTRRRPGVNRLDKSAMRRELSSLRAVANLHARASMAMQSTRKRTRQTWYKSAGLMAFLNFIAMGILAGGPQGLLRVIGWGLMLAAAAALAVCLHSFRRMVAENEMERISTPDQERSDFVSRIPAPPMPPAQLTTAPADLSGERVPVADAVDHGSHSSRLEPGGPADDAQASPEPCVPTIPARDEPSVATLLE